MVITQIITILPNMLRDFCYRFRRIYCITRTPSQPNIPSKNSSMQPIVI